MGNVPSPPCPVLWCTTGPAHTTHSAVLAELEHAGVSVAVELYQEAAGVPRVRLFVEEGDALTFTHVPAGAADELGRIITALGTPLAFEFAAALTRGATLLAGKAGR